MMGLSWLLLGASTDEGGRRFSRERRMNEEVALEARVGLWLRGMRLSFLGPVSRVNLFF